MIFLTTIAAIAFFMGGYTWGTRPQPLILKFKGRISTVALCPRESCYSEIKIRANIHHQEFQLFLQKIHHDDFEVVFKQSENKK